MKKLLLLSLLITGACERQSDKGNVAPQANREPIDVVVTQAPSSKPPAVIPLPKEQAELDRMILAGYTPHGTHLHPPGVNECPLAQGTEAVM